MITFGNDWDDILKDEFKKDYYLSLRKFLIREYSTHTIYPDMYDIYNAFKITSYSGVKAVILGQDPYHRPNQAHGLAFSVKAGTPPPPSLVNIFKELESDVGAAIPKTGELTGWATQGVMLLNTLLTVRQGAAFSHSKQGWERFTDTVISHLNARQKPIVFLLWGRHAKEKQNLLTNPNHYILTAPHPSPLSAYSGFFGCRHFSKANALLKQNGMPPINWQLS